MIRQRLISLTLSGVVSRPIRAGFAVSLLLLSGCDTSRQLLRLERDSLNRVVAAQTIVSQEAEAGLYAPASYDIHLLFGPDTFNQILGKFDGAAFRLTGDRPITISLEQARLDFRPGYPSISVSAKARDEKSELVAELTLDASVVIEGDPNHPGTLRLRLVTTRVVPNLQWGPLEIRKWMFARRLLAIEGMRYAEQLPAITLPLTSAFQIGGPAGGQDIVIPTGDGRVHGRIQWPSTEQSGAISVNKILFLRNGIHVFARVEGL